MKQKKRILELIITGSINENGELLVSRSSSIECEKGYAMAFLIAARKFAEIDLEKIIKEKKPCIQ